MAGGVGAGDGVLFDLVGMPQIPSAVVAQRDHPVLFDAGARPGQ
jgi:hypothetical protein